MASPEYEKLVNSDDDESSHKKSLYRSVLDFGNIFKGFIGTNYLGIPFAVAQSGLVLGCFGLVVVAAITAHCCQLIIKCKREVVINKWRSLTSGISSDTLAKETQYADIGFHVLGTPGELTVNFFLAVTQFFFCVGYFIFLGNTISDAVGLPSEYCVWFSLPPLMVCSLLKTVRSIAPLSAVANFAIFFGFISVLVYEGRTFKEMDPSVELVRFSTFPIFFGIAVASYEGIGTIIPIESSMSGNRNSFPLLLNLALALVTLILSTFSIFGYLRFGSSVSQIITGSLPESDMSVKVLRWALVIAVLFTYPLQMFPVISILEHYSFKRPGSSPNVLNVVLRFALVACSCGIAFLARNYFGYVSSFVGSFGSSVLAFILPCIFHQKLFRTSMLVRVKDIAIIVFGVLGGVAGIVSTAREIAQ